MSWRIIEQEKTEKFQQEQKQRDIKSQENSNKNKTILEKSGVIELFKEKKAAINSEKPDSADIINGFENHSISLRYENAPNSKTAYKEIVLHILKDESIGTIDYSKDFKTREETTITDIPSYINQKIEKNRGN